MKPAMLVAYDFSPLAEDALRWAADLRRSLGGGLLTVFHVVSPPPGTLMEGLLLAPPSEKELAGISAELRDVADRLAPGAEVEVAVAPNVASKLIEVAWKWNIDLIVMGISYKRKFGEFDLGHTAPYVLKNAPCRVWIARAAPAVGPTAPNAVTSVGERGH